MKTYQILDMIILVLVILFFVGMLGTSFQGLGTDISILFIPDDVQAFLDVLIYPIIALLGIDLVLKYRKTKNPKKFVRKYWIDIFMIVLIPVFSIFKFFKIGLSLTKQLKTLKMGAKVLQNQKNLQKNNFKVLNQ
ncbi:MAG: hypothetical protein PVH93_08650 [Nitrosopumilaceae archaeon]|jgi:hypothetical protein